MTENNKNLWKKFSDIDATTRKTIFSIFYWSTAVVVLIGAIFVVLNVTAPVSIPTQTPDITATIRQALAEALGPPTETLIPTETPKPTQPLPPSQTPLPSFTPSKTHTPTITPTASPTPLLPTLTPVLPNDNIDAFDIIDLSPSQYDYTIKLLEGLPEVLPDGTTRDEYFSSFFHAAIMQSDAIRAYPDDLKTPDWQWGLAYNLTRIRDDRSNILYATYLNNAVNDLQINVETLPEFVIEHDQRLILEITKVVNIQGNVNNYLLELITPGGSLFLWYAETTDSKQVYPLSDQTDFVKEPSSKTLWSDLNNDDQRDLIIFTPNKDDRFIDFPTIYDLTQIPPTELIFKPPNTYEIGLENETEWNIISNNQDFDDLVLTSIVYPPCPVSISHTYHWTGNWFERIQETYLVEPVSQLLQYCELLVDQATNVWGTPAAIQIMEGLLDDWPPVSTSEKSYPLDSGDEWRFRLGVYHSLEGNQQIARTYFEQVSETPVVPDSRWVKPAEKFLSNFETPEGLYKACVGTPLCDPRIAIKQWVASIDPQKADNLYYYMTWNKVSIRFTDKFDFEGDDRPERWFTIRHRPTDRLEFWILSVTDDQTQLLFVDTLETNTPLLTRYTNPNGQTYVWLGSQQSFSLKRYPNTSDASIELLPPSYYYAELTNQLSEESLEALLAGFSPRIILEELKSHREKSTFVCLSKENCGRFYYALGLAAELSGDERLAIESYLKIWVDSFESPFTTIVRMKLAYKPGFGPIPTPTISQTATKTPNPSLTSTPTVTTSSTPTITTTPPTPTPTGPTPTATDTQDPYP